MKPQVWPVPADPINFQQTMDVEIQVIGTPSVAYVPQRSFNGTDFVAANAYDKDGATVTSISAAGIYSMIGGVHLKLATGSGSTVYVRSGE